MKHPHHRGNGQGPLPMPPRGDLVELTRNKVSFEKIGKHYGVSISTVHVWFKKYEIATRVSKGSEVREIDGVLHKRCIGPFHNGKFLPIDQFHVKEGKLTARCWRCVTPNQSGVNFTSQYQAWVESIVNRIGVMETCRRLGVHDKTLRTWRGREKRPRPLKIKRQHAEAIVKLIAELRETGEVRHRLSIDRGATVRGEPERKVGTHMTSKGHNFYNPTDDAASEYKRRKNALK